MRRWPFYLVGGGLGLLVVVFLIVAPKRSAADKVQDQVAVLARDPWVIIQVQRLDVIGPRTDPAQVLVHGVRPDGSPVAVHFVARSPYTSPTAMRRLVDQPLEGRRAEIIMLPRSMVLEPFRSAFDPNATHAGVALFAGFPDRPQTPADGGPTTKPAGLAAAENG